MKNVNVKFDPKLHYGLELLTRVQRRNMSDVIRRAIKKEFVNAFLCPPIINLLNHLWRENEFERVWILNKFDPMLLTFEEEKFIKNIKESNIYIMAHEEVTKETGIELNKSLPLKDYDKYEELMFEKLKKNEFRI